MRLEVGSEIFHGNSRYRIIQVIDLEHVSVRSSFSGNIKKLHISELSSEPNDPNNPADIIPAKDLLSVPDDKWVEINNKALLFNQIMQENDECERRLQIKQLAKTLNLSEPTIYRQLQKYKESKGNPMVLLRKKRDDLGRFESEIEAIIQKHITRFLTKMQLKVTDIYRDLELDVIELNKTRAQTNQSPLETPHINTLRHRINQLSSAELATKREGKKGRDSHRPIIGSFPELRKPLEVVQIDHTPIDLIIVDDENRLEIGRPTVTLAIDVFSRMVAGFYVSLEKPNTLLTGACLTHAILDKKKWLLDHHIEGDWPVYGLMQTIHSDNGLEFHGKSLKRACEIYKINMTKRPAGTPRYGGHIERLFKTFNDGGIHALPGTTKSNVRGRAEYKSESHASMTLFEFETWFTDFIVNVYHRTVHSELGMTPLEKYTRAILGDENTPGAGLPPKIDNPIKLKIDFLPYEERSVQKYGIQLFGIDYFHDVLRKWIKQPDKTRKAVQKFIVRYDPRDLSSVFFYDPDMESYVVIPYRDISHPPISLWELNELKRKAKEANPRNKADEEAIFEARARMKRLTDQSQKDTKHVRREKQKESIRQKESLPTLVNEAHSIVKRPQRGSVFNSAEPVADDEDFDAILPFEDIDQ